jgi:GDP-6-deoxy-D-talose 4-dehydrogenase
MGKRVLVTGVDGFTGRYVARALAADGHEVHGLVRHELDRKSLLGVTALHRSDVLDPTTVRRVVDLVGPQWVVHLAAIAFVVHDDVRAMYETNLMGTRNLLEALAVSTKGPEVVLLASSANVYGNGTEGVLDEQATTAPANDYAVSKLAMEYMARLYFDRLPIIITRPFNYSGVGQAESFLLAKIVAHVRRAAAEIELGNLDIARDFSDVRAVAQAYLRLLSSPDAIGQTFNVCSGTAHTLTDVLRLVREISGRDFEVRVDPALVRAQEVKVLLGSRARLEGCIGTVAAIELRETLRWMLLADPNDDGSVH